jgi:hypothetical protein
VCVSKGSLSNHPPDGCPLPPVVPTPQPPPPPPRDFFVILPLLVAEGPIACLGWVSGGCCNGGSLGVVGGRWRSYDPSRQGLNSEFGQGISDQQAEA